MANEEVKKLLAFIEKANNDPDNELGYAICMLKDGTYENPNNIKRVKNKYDFI